MPERAPQAVVLARWLQGQRAAIALIEDLGAITQVWDDLVDGDPVRPEDATAAFTAALVHLWRNPFMLAHHADLVPLIEAWIWDWQAANRFEDDYRQTVTADPDRAEGPLPARLAASYTIRDNSAQVIVQCARLIGGWDWAVQVAPEVRAWLHCEPPDAYRDGLCGVEREEGDP